MRKLCLNAFAWCLFWTIYWTSSIVFAFRVRRTAIRDGNIAILRGWMPQDRDEFPRQVVLALKLIDEQDPRRAATVRNNLRFVVDSPVMSSQGQYDHDRKLCLINYDAMRSDFVGEYPMDERIQSLLTTELASLLIHEATHGRLMSRGIAYTDESWEQSERLCRAEQTRFRNRLDGNRADLRGRQIDWDQWHSIDMVKDSYLASRAMSHWDRLSYRFRAAYEVASRIQDVEQDQSLSVRDTIQPAHVVSTWPELTHAYNQHRDQPTFSPAVLESSAYAFKQCGLPVAAAECFELIQSHGWEMPCHAGYSYGMTLFSLRRFEEAIEIFRTIESKHPEKADVARLQIAYGLQYLDRFDDAQQMLASIELETIVNTQSWFHLGTALLQNDAAQAFEILDAVLGDAEPEDPADDEFYALSLRPYLAWLMGRQADCLSQQAGVLGARQRWLTENAETIDLRRVIVVDANESLYKHCATSDGATVMIRTDQDVSEEQLAPARAFAIKVREMARKHTTTENERTLQGLLYGNEDFSAREVDWDAIDPALRLDGTWFVVDLEVNRLFLDNGRLEGDLLQVWVKRQGDQPQCVLQGEFDLSQPFQDVPKLGYVAAAANTHLPDQPIDTC